MNATEGQIHKAIVKYMKWRRIPHFHVPNQGRRRKREASQLTHMGVSSGVPDLIIPVPPPILDPCSRCGRRSAPGVVLEVKAPDGVVSDNQRKWLARFNDLHWFDEVVDDSAVAIRLLQAWGF